MNNPGSDNSVLKPSIPTAIEGVKGYVHAYENGTAEVRHILLHECDIILECKVCKNLFRSLANFTSHKRFYCKVDYSHVRLQVDPNPSIETATELVQTEEVLTLTSQALSGDGDPAELSENTRVTKKALTSIVDKLLQKAGGVPISGQSVFKPPVNSSESFEKIQEVIAKRAAKAGSNSVTLESVKGVRTAVYQTYNPSSAKVQNEWLAKHKNHVPEVLPSGKTANNFPTNPLETSKDASKADPATEVRLNGPLSPGDSSIGDISKFSLSRFMDLRTGKPKCTECAVVFSTELNLKDHVIVTHLDGRVRYMCPVCDKPFPAAPNLRKHIREIHQTSGTKLEETLRKVVRKVHVNAETCKSAGTTPQKNEVAVQDPPKFGCQKCRRTFTKKDQLTSHEIFCTGNDKPCFRTKERHLSTSSVGSSASAQELNRNQVSSIQVRKDYNKKTSVPTVAVEKPESIVTSPKAHALVQSHIKDGACDICGMQFSAADSVTRHIATVHINWLRFACTLCSHKTWQRYGIIRHFNSHHSNVEGSPEDYVRSLNVEEQNQQLLENVVKMEPDSNVGGVGKIKVEATSPEAVGIECKSKIVRSSSDIVDREGKSKFSTKTPQVANKQMLQTGARSEAPPPIVSVSERVPSAFDRKPSFTSVKSTSTSLPQRLFVKKEVPPSAERSRLDSKSRSFSSPPTSPTRIQNRVNRKNLSTDRKLFIVLPMPKKNKEDGRKRGDDDTESRSSRASNISVASSPESKASTSSVDDKENKAKSKVEPIIASVSEVKELRKRKISQPTSIPPKRK